ncbi:MAG: hypothetical protein A2Z04_05380 [Chloroflexi bacterium RBG_16_57_9]|nr:MAG: hypothetical protein A2Z04_05380 [Chloroflexi bacterium RBG_16_57_9]
MTGAGEASRWLRDAEACLVSARRALAAQDFRVVVQNAQLCIEHSAKAIIAELAEPVWRHDPSPQLRRLLVANEEAIVQRCSADMPASLRQLAQDAEKAAPWHGWSTYGRETENQGWLAAVDLCNKDIAEDLLHRAQKAWPVAQSFIALWSKPPSVEEEEPTNAPSPELPPST